MATTLRHGGSAALNTSAVRSSQAQHVETRRVCFLGDNTKLKQGSLAKLASVFVPCGDRSATLGALRYKCQDLKQGQIFLALRITDVFFYEDVVRGFSFTYFERVDKRKSFIFAHVIYLTTLVLYQVFYDSSAGQLSNQESPLATCII